MWTFIELAPFEAVRDRYLDDEEFAALQWHLMEHPEAGDLIRALAAAESFAGPWKVAASAAARG